MKEQEQLLDFLNEIAVNFYSKEMDEVMFGTSILIENEEDNKCLTEALVKFNNSAKNIIATVYKHPTTDRVSPYITIQMKK